MLNATQRGNEKLTISPIYLVPLPRLHCASKSKLHDAAYNSIEMFLSTSKGGESALLIIGSKIHGGKD